MNHFGKNQTYGDLENDHFSDFYNIPQSTKRPNNTSSSTQIKQYQWKKYVCI